MTTEFSDTTMDMFLALEERIGKDMLAKRLRMQVDHAGKVYGKAAGGLHLEHCEEFSHFVEAVLTVTGFLRTGRKNAASIHITQNDVPISGLPQAFDGLRILHLSDIHIDGYLDGGAGLIRLIQSLTFDACVLSGDFRFLTMGNDTQMLDRMQKLAAVLNCEFGITGILGNHDFIESVPALESMQIRILLNEGIRWHRNSASLFVAGVDDPHFYHTDDLGKALQERQQNEPAILLVHSPELIEQAHNNNVSLYLCGHTHGGQICLPGGIPLITNARCSRAFVSGKWMYQTMHGFTSRGTGSSGVQARFNCPPEVILHTLRGT